ncbi:MAG: RibD family protein [Thermoplasmata archaeon]
MSARRPRVLVNCAVSADGRLAYAGGARARLSGPEDLARVQRLRAASDAIVVGIGTVLADDPSLRVHWELIGESPGRTPCRVVLDSRGRTPDRARVLDGSRPTLIATVASCPRRFPEGVEQFRGGEEQVDLGALLEDLAERGFRQILVEGGAGVLSSFFRAGLVDRATIYVAPLFIGGSTAPRLLAGPECPDAGSTIPLGPISAEPLGPGLLLTFAPPVGSSAPL